MPKFKHNDWVLKQILNIQKAYKTSVPGDRAPMLLFVLIL